MVTPEPNQSFRTHFPFIGNTRTEEQVKNIP